MPFVASKSKKIQKIDKNHRSKHLYLLRDLMRDLMNFNKMFGKNITYDDTKSIFLGLRRGLLLLFFE